MAIQSGMERAAAMDDATEMQHVVAVAATARRLEEQLTRDVLRNIR